MEIQVRFRIFKDPVSWATHFAGMLAALVGTIFLLAQSWQSPAKFLSMAIYGCSLVTLFGASAIYHFLDVGHRGNRWLQRLDHAAIFFLIAGSYVPAAMHLLDGGWRIAILSVVGSLAFLGMLFKVIWIDCPTWLGAGLYLGLGWLALIPMAEMLPRLDAVGLALLLSGGLAYTLGAVVFVREWPDPWPRVLGHHEIWHLFVLAGAAGHFGFAWHLLEMPVPAF
jgi:hemolysin III